MTSRESSDEKDRQRQAARESHKKVSLVIARRGALKDMTMDLEKRGSRVLPALATALARPSASSSHRRTCRPRRPNRLRLPEPCCCGDCQHPCPSPSRLSGLLGMRGALAGDAAAAAANYQNGLAVAALPSAGLRAGQLGLHAVTCAHTAWACGHAGLSRRRGTKGQRQRGLLRNDKKKARSEGRVELLPVKDLGI